MALPKKSKSLLSRSQRLIARDTEIKLLEGLNNLVDTTRKAILHRTRCNAVILPIISSTTLYDQENQQCKEYALRSYASDALNQLTALKSSVIEMETLVEESVHLLFNFPNTTHTPICDNNVLKDIWNSECTSSK